MRESGNDTMTRLDNISSNLNTIDLNSLSYKYEMDLCFLTKQYFDYRFQFEVKVLTSEDWCVKVRERKNDLI